MPVLTDDQIIDLAKTTQKELGKLKFNQIAQKLQRYEVLGKIMKKDKIQFDSGNGIQRNVMVKDSGAAKNVGLYEKDEVNVSDVMEQIDIPWRHTTTNYAFERREMAMNRGASRIVNLMKVRRTDAMLSLANLMEEKFWSKPENSNNKLDQFGVQYWVVPDSTIAAGVAGSGFYADAPTGFANGVGNLIHQNWGNFVGKYTSVTKTSLIAVMRRAHRKIGFESPVDVPDYRKGRGQQYRIYTGLETLENMEKLGEAQNENLGRDLASMDDTITFRRHPIVWVPQLDEDATAPSGALYMLDYAWFYPVFLRGEYLRETDPKAVSDQHTVFVTHIDLTWNLLCTDRRRQAVLYK